MKCEEAMERTIDEILGRLGGGPGVPGGVPGDDRDDGGGSAALRRHLLECPACALEASAIEALWDDLGHSEEVPSAALRQRFEGMLREAIEAERRSPQAPAAFAGRRSTRSGREARSLDRVALGLALAAGLAIALGAGVFIGSTTATSRGDADLAELRSEIRSLRTTVALALLDDASPSERLSGVAYGRSLEARDRRVVAALFETLREDPDVNVRLAALDALREEAVRPETRARLLESITAQESPLVQISVIDVLLESAALGSARGGAAAVASGGAGAPAGTADTSTRTGLERLADSSALDQVVRGYLRDRLERSSR